MYWVLMAGYPQLYVLWSSHRWSHRLCGPRIRISNNCLTLEQILSRDARRRYSVVLHICSSLVDAEFCYICSESQGISQSSGTIFSVCSNWINQRGRFSHLYCYLIVQLMYEKVMIVELYIQGIDTMFVNLYRLYTQRLLIYTAYRYSVC